MDQSDDIQSFKDKCRLTYIDFKLFSNNLNSDRYQKIMNEMLASGVKWPFFSEDPDCTSTLQSFFEQTPPIKEKTALTSFISSEAVKDISLDSSSDTNHTTAQDSVASYGKYTNLLMSQQVKNDARTPPVSPNLKTFLKRIVECR